MTTDLLSAPCQPGEYISTGVTLPLGHRVTALRCSTSFGLFTETHEDREDGTWYEVTAQNTGTEEARLVADIDYGEVVEVGAP